MYEFNPNSALHKHLTIFLGSHMKQTMENKNNNQSANTPVHQKM